MQVRKFEAKNMQEALNLVKHQLGPEAIILSAKDNQGAFGLGGEPSVEITAAISANKLQEHKFAMSRLKEQDQEKVLSSSAAIQKKFIEKSVERFRDNPLPRKRQYIDITDDEDFSTNLNVETQPAQTVAKVKTQTNYANQGRLGQIKKLAEQRNMNFVEEGNVNPEEPSQKRPTSERVKKATRSALDALSKDWVEEKPRPQANILTETATSNKEVADLKDQIHQLQKVINSFRDMPQSFVGTHPGAEYELSFEFSSLFQRLKRSGVKESSVGKLLKDLAENLPREAWKKPAVIEAMALKSLMGRLDVRNEFSNGIHIFIGASSSGKTSSLVKHASDLIINKKKKVAILSTDTVKLGASEQLKIYAKILNVPFGIVKDASQWEGVLNHLTDVDIVLVDTPGVALKNLNEIELIKQSIPSSLTSHTHIHYVQSCTTKEADALDMSKRFSVFNFDDMIITKLDESVNHGLIYTLNEKMNCPLLSFGIGPNIPEDFEYATKERIVDLIFKLSKR
ncbi:MAG: hypothetical protein AB8E15_04700 [Bdellovibrionales bacterium]